MAMLLSAILDTRRSSSCGCIPVPAVAHHHHHLAGPNADVADIGATIVTTVIVAVTQQLRLQNGGKRENSCILIKKQKGEKQRRVK